MLLYLLKVFSQRIRRSYGNVPQVLKTTILLIEILITFKCWKLLVKGFETFIERVNVTDPHLITTMDMSLVGSLLDPIILHDYIDVLLTSIISGFFQTDKRYSSELGGLDYEILDEIDKRAEEEEAQSFNEIKLAYIE